MDTILELVIFQIKEACMYLPTAFRLAATVCSTAALAGLSVCLTFHKKAYGGVCVSIHAPPHMAFYLRDLQLLRAPAYHFVTHAGAAL